MPQTELIAKLHLTYPFRDLPADELDNLTNGATLKTCASGQLLFREGEQARSFYFLDSGQVKLFRWAPNGDENTYQLLRGGQLLAEAAMFTDPAVYPMNARVMQKTKLYGINRDRLIGLFQSSPEFSLRLISSMARKLNQSMNRIDRLTMNSAGQRVVAYLLDLHTLQHGHWLELPVSYAILAKQLAITTETLSRLLQKFRDQGLISGKRRTLVLLDINALCDFVGLPQPEQMGLATHHHRHPENDAMVGCCNLS